jgi:ectoine hydroxylase
MREFRLTDQQIRTYNENGYLLVENLFTEEEVGLLRRVVEASQLVEKGHDLPDAQGGRSKMWSSNDLKEDVFSAFSRNHRIVNPMRQLLRDNVLFFHHKMSIKEPRVGGRWEWHQDYGYWYPIGFLYPDLASCMVAIDPSTEENGCLQVLRGSHKLGRLDHYRMGEFQIGKQTGADLERIELIKARHELVYCNMQPGTALFFHSNTLHSSDQNRSDRPRWTFICCFAASYNRSFMDATEPHARTSAEQVGPWSDEKISQIAESQLQRYG